MDKLVIEPSGPLRGTVAVSAAKNASLPILAATLLTEDASVIRQVPHVTDVVTMIEIPKNFVRSQLRVSKPSNCDAKNAKSRYMIPLSTWNARVPSKKTRI